jgi:hypothetical protein
VIYLEGWNAKYQVEKVLGNSGVVALAKFVTILAMSLDGDLDILWEA